MQIRDPDAQGQASRVVLTAVEAWAETWYRDEEGRDRLSFDGIPCGDAIRVDVFEFVLEAVNSALGLPARRLGRPAFRQLRARGLDREARTWGLRAASLGRRQLGGRLPVAFISEGATPSALESSLAVAGELTAERAAIGASDPRSYRAWRRHGWEPVPLLLDVREERRVAKRSTGRSTEAWHEARSACPPLVVGGKDLTPVALRTMDRFVSRSVTRLEVEWRAIERFLDDVDPRIVVLASDQHRTGRLAVEIARKQGRGSVVLQHGLPQARTGYLPVHADVVLAWSDMSAAWFLEGGTAPERVAVVGNPRLDALVGPAFRDIGGARTASADQRAPRTVLLALSVAPVAVNARLVGTTLDAVQSLADTSLIVKLHPGGSDWGFVRRLVSEHQGASGRITVLEREPLYPLLARADVVVVHRSSVAAEALAARRPVIAIAVDGTSTVREDLVFVDLPEVGDYEELARLLVEYSGDPGSAEFLARRSVAITAAVGPVDGLATQRAADAILVLASAHRPASVAGSGSGEHTGPREAL